MKLTIIIPVYKVANTLQRCVESVVCQLPEKSEIILVDDGSPDECPALCEELVRQHQHVSVLHKTNGGLSSARNYGLMYAKGEYVTFIDSDDELSEETLKPLMDIMLQHPEYDILEFPASIHHDHSSQHTLNFTDKSWQSASKYWLETSAWNHCYAWNKIYKRRLFDAVRFPDGKIFEDLLCYPQILRLNPIIATTSKGLYKYMYNESGISALPNRTKILQLLKAELQAASAMHTLPFGKGANLYYAMLCRIYDLLRLR